MNQSTPKVRPRNRGASIWLDGVVWSGFLGEPAPEFLRRYDVTGVRFSLPVFDREVSTGAFGQAEIVRQSAAGSSAAEIYTKLLVQAVQEAADLLGPTFEEAKGSDGFVTVPLPADLSFDEESLVEEAVLLTTQLERENVIILVPATTEGIAALQHLTAAGVSAGVQHLLSVRRYREAFDSYLNGLERQTARNVDLRHMNSIAEFALGHLETIAENQPASGDRPEPAADGGLAVSTARVAYGAYLNSVFSERFQKLAKTGLRAQRLAWSCSAVSESHPAALPDQVIGPATVCEMPGDAIRRLYRRSLSGFGLSEGLPEAQTALELYEQRRPNLEQLRANEVERLVTEQVLSSDRAVASIQEMCARAR